jgi:hypothetical protein
MTKKEKEDSLKMQYKTIVKSIYWWESELSNIYSFFENYKKIQSVSMKRLKQKNKKSFYSLIKRGHTELNTLNSLETEIIKFYAKKDKE